MGRTYSCWMLNYRCITWPIGFKRLNITCCWRIKDIINEKFHGMETFKLFSNWQTARQSQDSVVGVATRLRPGRPRVRILIGVRDYSLPPKVQSGSGTLPVRWVSGLFTGSKRVLTWIGPHTPPPPPSSGDGRLSRLPQRRFHLFTPSLVQHVAGSACRK